MFVEHMVTEQLGWSVCAQSLRCFVVDDDPLVDDHVDPLCRKRFAAVVHHHPDLAIDPKALGNEIALHRETVDVLSIAKPKGSVDVAERIDDRPSRRRFQKGPCGILHVNKLTLRHGYAGIKRVRLWRKQCDASARLCPFPAVGARIPIV